MTPQDLTKAIVAKIADFAIDTIEAKVTLSNVGSKSIMLATDILDAVQGAADEMAKKAYGDCDSCYGKGYNSYLQPGNTASADFVGDKPITLSKPKLVYQLCKCARGRSLKQVIMANPIWTDPHEQKAE